MTTYSIQEIKENPYLLKKIEKQTPELCLVAVEQDWLALRFVRDQTPELCLAAVEQDWWALKLVHNQTPELCLTAVKQNWRALKFVHNQTPELCLVAVEQDGFALQFVKNIKRTTLEQTFGTYKGTLSICKYQHIKAINAGCWYGSLEEFKVKVWERFNLGFKHQRKEDVESIIKEIELIW